MVEKRHKENKKLVEAEFTKSAKVKKQKKKKEKKALETAEVNTGELERRQAFLRAQKELITKKRFEEREKELKTYEKENKSGIPPPATVSKSSAPEPVAEPTPEEKKQQASRQALAMRFKSDMMARKARVQEQKQDDCESLAHKLRHAEDLRRKVDDASQAEMAIQEKARKQQLAQFHKNLSVAGASAGGF